MFLRPKTNIRNLLNSILELEPPFDTLWYVDTNGTIDSTNDMFTIKGIIILLLECVRYSLFFTISYFANGLMASADHYMKQLYGQGICSTELEFNLTAATLRNNNIIPGDFESDGDNG